jgi:hypothetical protein
LSRTVKSLRNQRIAELGEGNKWQQMAAFWQHPGSSLAADGPRMAAGMAANGSRMAANGNKMAAGLGLEFGALLWVRRTA